MNRLVYHASEKSGVELFTPRKYWHKNDFSQSGRIDGVKLIPEDTLISNLFFACTLDSLPFYFFPTNVLRLLVPYSSILQNNCLLKLLAGEKNIIKHQNKYCLVVDLCEKERLINYRFSIYAFEARYFFPVSNNNLVIQELVTQNPIKPVKENRNQAPINLLNKSRHNFIFVKSIKYFCEYLVSNDLKFSFHGPWVN